MKKMIFLFVTVIAVFSSSVICTNAVENNETELLALFNNMGKKAQALVEESYPEGIFEEFKIYEMRIDKPEILAVETSDGKILARIVNTEKFLSFFNEVFTEEISARLLPSAEIPMAKSGVFEYDGILYQMGGYSGLLREMYVGPDAEKCVSYAYGYNTTVPYDELIVNGNEAVMKLTLWEPNVTGGVYVGLRKTGRYDVTFLKTSEGWKVSGGSFTAFLGFKNGSAIVSPATADENYSHVYALAAVAGLSAMICAAAVTVRRRKVS